MASPVISSKVRSTRSLVQKSAEISGNFVEKDFWVSRENNVNGLFQQEPEHQNYQENDEDDRDTVRNEVPYMDNDDNFYHEDENSEVRRDENNENIISNISFTDQPIDFNKNLVSAPKFTYAQQLNYARVAKRVDVAKLKSTLWNEFLEESQKKSKTTKNSSVDSKDNTTCTNNSYTFSSLMNNLSKTYPSEALADVSVPYCFICLLHLANEKNLEIQNVDKDLIIRNWLKKIKFRNKLYIPNLEKLKLN